MENADRRAMRITPPKYVGSTMMTLAENRSRILRGNSKRTRAATCELGEENRINHPDDPRDRSKRLVILGILVESSLAA